MSEETNVYVSSRGLMKICNFYSSTPYSSIQHLIHFPSVETLKRVKNPVIYICSSALPHFINTLLNKITFQFILVSGDCDETVPFDIFKSHTDYESFIQDNRIVHWFVQNYTLSHPKITNLPIGMDYHTMTVNPMWGAITSCNDQEYLLQQLVAKSKPFWERMIKCYSNFHFSVNTRHAYDRIDAIDNLKETVVYYEVNKVGRLQTWNTQCKYAFVISPHGGGYDCHRTWEALLLGCIPIVKKSNIDCLYIDLPVLIVNQWTDVTETLLKETIELFKTKIFRYEKLRLDYWKQLIFSYQIV